jgi:bifunctional UDP-N-acetylglucosamine pyrophosphorylase/glucosamine-1-phosphate N-acetyltransferase
LVAPITINEDSIVGAGSVITKNVRKKSQNPRKTSWK